MKTLNCKGQLIALNTPKVMGILNVTPDSFYDGGTQNTMTTILKTVDNMLQHGATFIDIGGYSSRPGADDVSETDELQRVIPVIQHIMTHFPDTLISVDTFRSEVAKQSIDAGAALINDISAGQLDTNMLKTVGELGVPYIMMHMRGTPKTMTQLSNYTNLITDIIHYFSERIFEARQHQIKDIIIDPGFGFAKNTSQNFTVLQHLQQLQILNFPILAGVSRKSMIYKTLNTTADDALNGTTALHMVALQQGAKLLRAHDVKEAQQCVTLYNSLQQNALIK